MNKWQIICPLAAIAIVATVFAVVSGSNHHRYYVYAQTRMIGQELIATTNSTRLVQIGPGLQKRLSEFLVSPAGVAGVISRFRFLDDHRTRRPNEREPTDSFRDESNVIGPARVITVNSNTRDLTRPQRRRSMVRIS